MIRKVSQKDIQKISELYEKKMSQQFKEINEKPITSKEYEKILKANIKKSNMYILNNKGVRGFIWYAQEKDEFNLEEIFTTEKNKGWGKLLISQMLEHARKNKIKRINLDVHFKNKKAQKFFKHFGFTERTIEMSLDL